MKQLLKNILGENSGDWITAIILYFFIGFILFHIIWLAGERVFGDGVDTTVNERSREAGFVEEDFEGGGW